MISTIQICCHELSRGLSEVCCSTEGVKLEGPHFIFPGGGTMFPDGAEQYIEKLGQYIPINGGVLRTALDMGCGVGSIFLFPFETLLLEFLV